MNPDQLYDQAKKRRRQAEGYKPGVRPINKTPGRCAYCGQPIKWGRLPDHRWQLLEPDSSPDGTHALLFDHRAFLLPLGATTLPEVVRHHTHRCEAQSV